MSQDKKRIEINKALILEFLYENKSINLSKITLAQDIRAGPKKNTISLSHLTESISYLEKEDLIATYQHSYGSIICLTKHGIDVVKNISKYKEEYPFVVYINNPRNVTLQFTGNSDQVIQISNSSKISIKQSMKNSFNKARHAVNSSSRLDEKTKKQALKNIDILEDESEKEIPDKGRIRRAWSWLQRNAPIVIPILVKVVEIILQKR